MTNASILLVEDEADIRELIQFNLMKEGYKVFPASDGEEGLALALNQSPDLILLDLMMPKIDGLELCRILKNDEKTNKTPIVMLTAKDSEEDIVKGLETGADDYITKPFSPKILTARVKAVLRRSPRDEEQDDNVLSIGDITIDPQKRKVTLAGSEIKLTFTEFQILHLLMQKPGWVFTRSQIVDLVRGENHAITDRSVDVQIVALRKKLGESGTSIETVRGVGYRFHDVD